MSTYCAPLMICFYFAMKGILGCVLPGDTQAYVIEAFNSMSRHLDDLFEY